MKIPVLITGGHGQLGLSLRDASTKHPDFDCHFMDIPELDICDRKVVGRYITENRIKAVVNAAAYTAVDKAESEEEKVLMVNATGVSVLAEQCVRSEIPLIHISTDYVFDGQGTVPYPEDYPTHPVSAYGRTKLAGERAFIDSGVAGLIIRTSWLYSEYGNNFVKTILRLSIDRDILTVVSDQQGSPTYAGDLAEAILHILPVVMASETREVLHYCNQGVTTWFGFASKVISLSKRSCLVEPITTQDYPTAAVRPAYSVLDTSRIRTKYGLTIPGWELSLETCLRNLDEYR